MTVKNGSSTRPYPQKLAPRPTLWLDFTTGKGLTDMGAHVAVQITDPGAHSPSLSDLLDEAHRQGASRIMLCGAVPPQPERGKPHWLITSTPRWKATGHWLANPPTGRFELAGVERNAPSVEIRTCREWFGTDDLSPADARDAWLLLTQLLASKTRSRIAPLLTPARTSTQLWAACIPENMDLPYQDPDIAESIHANSTQHRIEHLAGSGCDCGDCVTWVNEPEIPEFTYIDGRFMYGKVCGGLASGTGRWITSSQCYDLLAKSQAKDGRSYLRARFLVDATVPDAWSHIGLLPVKHPNGVSWHYPSRPGAKMRTWLDAVEYDLARVMGWEMKIIEGIYLGQQSAVLTSWANKLRAMREEAAQSLHNETVKSAAASAIRAILITGVGAFATRGRKTTLVADSIRDLPPDLSPFAERRGNQFVVVKAPQGPPQGRNQATYRPELASQIWAKARARVLHTEVKIADRSWETGALSLPPKSLIGINGDAIYTALTPRWALPEERGGADDGKVGSLRIKGHLPGPLPTPQNSGARNTLRAQAESVGWASVLSGTIRESPIL